MSTETRCQSTSSSQATSAPNITPEREAELRRLKASYPYRIVYAADKPDGSDWHCSAVLTRHVPNKLAREGYRVAVLS